MLHSLSCLEIKEGHGSQDSPVNPSHYMLKGKGKVVPVLNSVPRNEGVLGRRGTAPRIL
jgi:hypothetical protein